LNRLFEKKLEEYDDDEELINDELEQTLEDSIENYEIP
jgi:succinylglutamate desuccinylase